MKHDTESGPMGSKQDFHLRGNYAPIADEAELTDLAVEGAIPAELDGLYVRNGPNPKSGTSPHWFLGDGMLHGLRLRQGKALWYRNRFIRTRQLEGARYMSEDLKIDHTVGPANTHIVPHHGELFALVESSFPTRISTGLDTEGVHDFAGKLKHAFTAHPKICPQTGEMHAFGYSVFPPFCVYHRVARDGSLAQTMEIPVAAPTMMHDFALTASHVIFMDLPVVFDPVQAAAGTMPFRWSDEHSARLGVLPRNGTAADIRWFEVAPCYVFHVANAFEDENGRIVMDVARYDELWRAGSGTFNAANLYRWRLDLTAGSVSEQPLDDMIVEFPRVDDRRTGVSHRHIYTAGTTRQDLGEFRQLIKYDLTNGNRFAQDFGADAILSEFTFVPAQGSTEDDAGWLMGFVYSGKTGTSDFLILDAQTLERPPVARIPLPRRVPQGFHGNWMDLTGRN